MKKETIFLWASFFSLLLLWKFLYGEASPFDNESVWFGFVRHAHGGVFLGASFILGYLFFQQKELFEKLNLKRFFSLELKKYAFWILLGGLLWEFVEYYLFATQGSIYGRLQDVNPFLGADFPIDMLADLTGGLLVRWIYLELGGKDIQGELSVAEAAD